MFAGYIDYGVHTKFKPIKVVTRWLTHLPAGARKAIARFCKGKTFPGAWHLYANLAPAEESFIGQARVFEESQSEQLLKPEYRKAPSVQSIVDKTYARVEGKGLSELKKKQYLDMHQWMPGDILLKADKMTMAHSLELRVPLLDKELMGVAEQVPTKYLITDENTKYAFRQAAGRHLPKEWYDREKLGFPVPIKKWLREEKFYKYVRSVFERDYVSQFFDQDALLKMIDDNYAGKTDDRRKIWTVYSFLTWYDSTSCTTARSRTSSPSPDSGCRPNGDEHPGTGATRAGPGVWYYLQGLRNQESGISHLEAFQASGSGRCLPPVVSVRYVSRSYGFTARCDAFWHALNNRDFGNCQSKDVPLHGI